MKRNLLDRHSIQLFANSIWLGPLGAIIAWYSDVPVPFLIGPTVLCSLAAWLGLKFAVPNLVKNLAFIIIGLTLGSNVTPDTLALASKWPVSLICMSASVFTITIFGQYFLNYFFFMDKNSSVLASSPGHLSFVLSISNEINGETAKISVIQSTRVLILTLITPLMIFYFGPNSVSNNIFLVSPSIPLFELVVLIFISASVGLLINKTKIPAPFLISGMICSTFSNGTGLTHGEVPINLTLFAFVIIGTLIGSRFVSVNLSLLRASFVGGVLLTFMSTFLAVLFAYITYRITDINFMESIIAFAPGGLETMIAMGTLVNADPTYIAIHHVSRIFLLSFLVPLLIHKENQV